MNLSHLRARLRSKYTRTSAEHLFRRPFSIHATKPIISFTFDDFPRTALTCGAAVLESHGAAGTFYVSLGLADKVDASGLMYHLDDLGGMRARGHELGCHTYDHLDSAGTASGVFLDSVRANQAALDRLLPGEVFRAFSYPKSSPGPRTKQLTARRFETCRGGGQTFNTGTADLNYLRAFFIEQARGGLAEMQRIVDENNRAGGWLIFATHDVCEDPSPYGTTPKMFRSVVRYAAESGAEILPVSQAFDRLREGQ